MDGHGAQHAKSLMLLYTKQHLCMTAQDCNYCVCVCVMNKAEPFSIHVFSLCIHII